MSGGECPGGTCPGGLCPRTGLESYLIVGICIRAKGTSSNAGTLNMPD